MTAKTKRANGAKVGYARVSTQEQHLDLQLDALNKAGCGKVFTDKLSGASAERPGLEATLNYLREGDTLVVWKLDRLGRSLPDLITRVAALKERNIGFQSVQENLDTATPGGKLFFHLFGALAEFERDLIRERTVAGLAAARARGRKGGRPKALDQKRRAQAQSLYDSRQHSVAEICRTLGISRATFYRYVRPGDGVAEQS